MGTYVRQLGRLCRKWGGELRLVSQDTYEDMFCVWPRTAGQTMYEAMQAKAKKLGPFLSEAPFTDWHGIDWKNKIVFVVEGKERIDAIIHEMGHIFAAPKMPDACDEWGFFGWEISLAKHLDCFDIWSRGNADYSVADQWGSWGGLSPKEKFMTEVERVAFARTNGLLDKRKRPLAIR